MIYLAPDLAGAAMIALWFVQLEHVESRGRDFLNFGRSA